MNTDKMRRNIARNTPDKVTRFVDAYKYDTQQELEIYLGPWIDQFTKRMHTKHKGRPLAIRCWYTETFEPVLKFNLEVEFL